MRSTARDVAKMAGVSISTVSRALSAPQKVATGTRQKVEQAARTLGYDPNLAARELATGRTGNLGLVIPDLENPFFASVTKAVQARARAAGHAVFVADTDEDTHQEPRLVRSLARQVDGVILCAPRVTDAELAALEAAAHTRMILINRTCGDMPSVTADHVDGVRQALRHLRALGHRHIAYAGGPSRSWADQQRRAGLTTAAEELGDVTVDDLGAFAPVFSGGMAAADLVLASGATAVLAYNDLMAIGLLARARERGVEVPGELSVVSFDDIPLAVAVSPALTTVAVPVGMLARTAVDLLTEMIDEERTGAVGPPARRSRLDLPVELKVRGTTGPRR
ncbi:LacI family DNA-binding transcriptional regulator [Georgenia ruanii]|uniref:LacI family DNA-binding transcriptional regulator n=1 Tax=Georgenia ruanii TaxID=348442 RepID=A0A7J9UX27_9MICO|nr:LacI family DNA-binding transcriptional regulator [Georgenia ruanii]MPV88254.1 LacI family DNA-binding transcriptional regulator [Georgenia ruanii]